MSGPLVTGQTSISSSLLSMDSLKNEIDEGGIEPCAHRKEPEAFVGECRAFYRVLFGHQNCTRAGEVQVIRRKEMVIGERMALRIDAELAQRRKKALGMRNRRHRVHIACAPRVQCRPEIGSCDVLPRQR